MPHNSAAALCDDDKYARRKRAVDIETSAMGQAKDLPWPLKDEEWELAGDRAVEKQGLERMRDWGGVNAKSSEEKFIMEMRGE